jgi:enoyl-CoA hydratase/carnithine racemase
MAYETLLLETVDHVGVITLNRPEARNALNRQMTKDLQAALRGLREDAEVHVVLLRGAGDQAFCAGADLKEVAACRTVEERRQQFGGIAVVFELMATMRKPVIGAVRGFALAGGCGLAAACDLVVAAEDAVFATPEIQLGLFPMMIMAPIFRTVGAKRGLELIFTGGRVDAREAERWGLVNRVVPPEALEAEALALARDLAAKSSAVLQLGKEAYYHMRDLTYLQALPYLREMIAVAASTEDAAEGVAAFLEKRKPVWKGR